MLSLWLHLSVRLPLTLRPEHWLAAAPSTVRTGASETTRGHAHTHTHAGLINVEVDSHCCKTHTPTHTA